MHDDDKEARPSTRAARRRPSFRDRSRSEDAARVRGDARDSWESHWARLSAPSSAFGRLSSFVRRQVLNRAVLRYAAAWFPQSGVFVELGCGSAESSIGLPAAGRSLVALDFSAGALRQARSVAAFASFLQADLERLPFRSASVDGAWNLGVLEHFDSEKGIRILAEIRRTLKPGGVAVLFWPPDFGSSRLVLAPIEALRSWMSGRPFRFFPDEVNRLRSKAHAREMLAAAGLEAAAIDFSLRAALIHLVVVARRPAAC